MLIGTMRFRDCSRNLVAFGDMHAFSSVRWPDGPPESVPPSRSALEAALHDNGLDSWLDDALRGTPSIHSADQWISKYRNLCRFGKITHEMEPDDESVNVLRERERRAWPQFGQSVRESAIFFESAVSGYTKLHDAISDPLAGASSVFVVIEPQRKHMIQCIASGPVDGPNAQVERRRCRGDSRGRFGDESLPRSVSRLEHAERRGI